MNYWMETTGSIEKGLGFSHFDPLHIGWLIFWAAFTAGLCFAYRRMDGRQRDIARKAVALAIAANELFKAAVLLIGGRFTKNYLPLHLCSINIFLIAWHAWRPNRVLDNFLYAICLPGAAAALLFPGWTRLPLANFMHIHSFTIHILLAAYPVMLLSGGDLKPDARQLPKCLGLLGCFVVLALAVNLVLDTNYMYLMYAPKGNPLGWFRDHLGNHLWGFPIIIGALWLVMYAPVSFRKNPAASRRRPHRMQK